LLVGAGALCAGLAVQHPALAAGRLGSNGSPIETSSYSIDLYQGAVFAGNRVMGLSGAYVAIAEDVDGDLQNPAAPAMRPFYSIENFDYSLGLGLTFPGRLASIDFFNSGSVTGFRGSSDQPVFVTPALNLQWGTFGIGLTAELQDYELTKGQTAPAASGGSSASLEAVLTTFHVQFANAFLDGQLVAGVGLRVQSMDLDEGPPEGNSRTLFGSSGSGIEVGAVWRPNLQPYRLGIAFRSPIDTQPSFSRNLLPSAQGDLVVASNGKTLYLPERVSLPWDVNVGAAFQIGRRPLNPIPRTVASVAERATLTYRLRELDREEERERRLALAQTGAERAALETEFAKEAERDAQSLEHAYAEAKRALNESFARTSRQYLLLSASLVVSGHVRDAVGVESFLDQNVNRSGTHIVYSPRIGAESEVWEERLKLRGGAYLEPTRFETSHPRLHGTLGADVRLFRWNVFGLWPDDFMWQLGGSIDLAERYLTWGVSLSGWYPRRLRSESVDTPLQGFLDPAGNL
jgi:hypothetical protein